MANIMKMAEYDKVVRRFVAYYVDNLTPDQMREIISEQSHIDLENIRQDTGQVSVFEEMSGWDNELWIDTATHFNLPDLEDMYDE